jgi:aspartate/tyrosine/aromatic aminotransferase
MITMVMSVLQIAITLIVTTTGLNEIWIGEIQIICERLRRVRTAPIHCWATIGKDSWKKSIFTPSFFAFLILGMVGGRNTRLLKKRYQYLVSMGRMGCMELRQREIISWLFFGLFLL